MVSPAHLCSFCRCATFEDLDHLFSDLLPTIFVDKALCGQSPGQRVRHPRMGCRAQSFHSDLLGPLVHGGFRVKGSMFEVVVGSPVLRAGGFRNQQIPMLPPSA